MGKNKTGKAPMEQLTKYSYISQAQRKLYCCSRTSDSFSFEELVGKLKIVNTFEKYGQIVETPNALSGTTPYYLI